MDTFAKKFSQSSAMFLHSHAIVFWISVTVFAFVMFLVETLEWGGQSSWSYDWLKSFETMVFVGIVAFLVYGNLVYQCTRKGYFKRKSQHRPATDSELQYWYETPSPPSVSIFVPAFKEEPHVVYQTLLSAALQDYPNRRVTLLIDDPPNSTQRTDQDNLTLLRSLPSQIQKTLDSQKTKVDQACAAFIQRQLTGQDSIDKEVDALAALYREIEHWFQFQAFDVGLPTHTDRWFVQHILLNRAEQLKERAATLQQHPGSSHDIVTRLIHQEYRYLQAVFSCQLNVFERKRYENLSHEPNKAMNLNTYIGLMGRRLKETSGRNGLWLEPCAHDEVGFEVSDAKYVLTLDADSLLLPDYSLRLVHFMEQPQNERVAVAQTPYSAVPHAPNLIERIAGATTDIQYLIHQGFTEYEGTFWVGANALLRKSALEEIAQVEATSSLPIIKFIQDRTVIEDTESSIDLVARGWTLYNYPERLAYSATPPDFGALLIQRRRWANGGLLILPNCIRSLFQKPFGLSTLKEGFIRCHYLSSIAGVNVGLVFLLFYPFDDQMNSLWLPLTAIPYFVLYGYDLRMIGYTWRDLPRVYALNLLLLPVHLGGVIKSLHQAATDQKTPFCRTPKVPGRTFVPALYLGAVFAMLGGMVWGAVDDFFQHYWMHMIFACMNAGFLSYAIIQYVGVQATWQDLHVGVRQYSSWCGDALEMWGWDTQISSMESEKSIATGSLPLSPRPKYELSTKERMIMLVHRRRISLLARGD